MRQLSIRDIAAFWEGRELEREIARQMLERGYSVMRCYDLDVDGKHKAPMLEGPYKGLRLPDLQVSVLGKTDWRECKRKGKADYTRITGEFEHGIGLRCYRDYVAVQEISGLSVYLMVGERNTGEILFQSLEKLGPPRVYEDDKMDPGGMAFWPRDLFDKWGNYDDTPGQTSLFPKRQLREPVHYAPERRWGVIKGKAL